METIFTISTTKGDIKIKLYDQTPLHRDNFIKLVKDGFYNGILFHRVIKNFMIQCGDPNSRNATSSTSLGSGGPGYTIPAEIHQDLIHKRGALAAARLSDEVNPKRDSSGSQFYIAWGQIYKDNQLDTLSKQLKMQAEQQIFNSLVQENRVKILELRRKRDQEGLMELQNDLEAQTKAISANRKYGLTELQRKTYSTVGGVPHLDGQYTVFGEVIEGLDIVEKIQNSQTNSSDRPLQDIFIQQIF